MSANLGNLRSSGPIYAQAYSTTSNIRESFSITLNSDRVIPTGTGNVEDWTDTLDNATFPLVDEGILYNEISIGTLNLSAGLFTCNRSGIYNITLTLYDYNNTGTVRFGISNISDGTWVTFITPSTLPEFPQNVSTQVYITSGHQFNMQTFVPGSAINFSKSSSIPLNSVVYPTLMWSMTLIN